MPITGFKLQFTISREKESLADAKLGISARQQWCMKVPRKEIYSKSIICDFLLTVMVTVAVLLTACEICSRSSKIAIFGHCILIVDPLAEENQTINVRATILSPKIWAQYNNTRLIIVYTVI